MVEKYFYAQVCAFVPNLVGSIYPTEAPQKTPLPYGVYNCTGSSMNTTLTTDTLFSETLQLDIYAETYKEAKGYFDTLRIAFMGFSGDMCGYPVKWVKVENGMDGFEPDVLEQKTTLEFKIYY
jgi:hypothetical protein